MSIMLRFGDGHRSLVNVLVAMCIWEACVHVSIDLSTKSELSFSMRFVVFAIDAASALPRQLGMVCGPHDRHLAPVGWRRAPPS